MPKGLAGISSSDAKCERLKAFERQIKSGYVGHLYESDSSQISSPWDPISNPRAAWHVYSGAIRDSLGADSAVFMNYFLWGSCELKEFRKKEPDIFRRSVLFSDKIFSEVLSAVRPKVIIVPFSLVREAKRSTFSGAVLMSLLEGKQEEYEYLDRGRQFKWFSRAGPEAYGTPLVIGLPHPASIRLSKTGREEVGKKISLIISNHCKVN